MEKKPLLQYQTPPTPIQRLRVYINKYATKDVLFLTVYVVLYVVSGVINSLLLRKVMTSFQNYPFFLNQLTNYGYIPIFGAVVLYELRCTKLISKEMRIFPWWKFFVMGLLDAVCGYFVVIGGISTSGPMQQLLNQAIIPVTMIGAFAFLKERYSMIQIGGSLLIVGGVIISLVPSLQNKSDNTGNVLFWNMFYLCQVIPFAASNVYKDVAFKSVDMDVWYLQFWDVFWQSVIGTLLFPINTILPEPATIHWNEIGSSMKNGGECLVGNNLITTCGAGTPHVYCDECVSAWWILCFYMAINVAYNVFILLVIKYGSATVLSIAQTIRLPLTNICFSNKTIMGKDAIPFSGYTLYGLLVILAGLISYRTGSLTKKKPEGAEGESQSHRVIPHIGPSGGDYVIESVSVKSLIIPKTDAQVRRQYFNKLGFANPGINA